MKELHKEHMDLTHDSINSIEAICDAIVTYMQVKIADDTFGLNTIIDINKVINMTEDEHTKDIKIKQRRMFMCVLLDELAILSKAMYIKHNVNDRTEEQFYMTIEQYIAIELKEYGIHLY